MIPVTDKSAHQQEVERLLQEIRQTPGANNEPVLGVNLIDLQRGAKGGYPRHLYHESLDPAVVLNRKEEQALATHGYVRDYKHKTHPKYLFRRNFDPRFEKSEFIEDRLIE